MPPVWLATMKASAKARLFAKCHAIVLGELIEGAKGDKAYNEYLRLANQLWAIKSHYEQEEWKGK